MIRTACASLALLVASFAHAAPRPNVILVLADDLAFGDLACRGNPHARTPNIDSFATASTEFSRFYVSPVCSPTRASLMTGRYNLRTGVADVFGPAARMDPAEVTLAEVLRDAGYATGIFGKWHLGDDGGHEPKSQGFTESLVHPGPALRQYFDPELIHNGNRSRFKGYCMDIFTDHAVAFMENNQTRPFFVYLSANLIHTPLQVDESLTAPFAGLGLSDSTVKVYGMLSSLDDSFGRLLRGLKELGLEENTLVVFMSDNGPCSGSVPLDRHMAGLHGLKGTVYENGIRSPFFARWPAGFASPATVSRIAAHIDLVPTVLDCCGLRLPGAVVPDGVSLLPLLRQPSAPWPERELFLQWDSGQIPRRGHAFAVVGERWQLVQPQGMDQLRQQHIRDRYAALCALQGRGARSIDGSPKHELYDLIEDPFERNDRATDHPEIVAALRARYDHWFDDVSLRWKPPAS